MKHSEKFGYEVELDRRCDNSEHDGEMYGSWEESWSNSFVSIKPVDKYPDVVSIHNFKPGDVAYLVWAEWSTGDSFGRADRGQSEALMLLKQGVDAYELADKLQKAKVDDTKVFNERCCFKWTSSDGDTYESGFLPWLGYFDSLDTIHVECVQF